MLADGSLPDKPSAGVPMRAVFAAASTMNPDAEAKAQQLSQQTGMGVDLVRHNPQAAQQRAVVSDLDQRDLETMNPILARQLQNPNFAGVAHDDLDSLSQIEQGANTMRALTPMESFGYKYLYPVQQKLMEFPLTRWGVDAVAGTSGFAGNVGSYLGWHGDNATRKNVLQRVEGDLSPEAANIWSNGKQDTGNILDTTAEAAGPTIPIVLATGGFGAILEGIGLSGFAARVATALGMGAAFTADQGGRTFTQMSASGRSDSESRRAANLVAGINAPLNVAMGLTDFIPALERNPLLSALGIGGAAGATGQLSQNVVTGQPKDTDLIKGALEGAATQGGFHLGFSMLEPMEHITDAVEASKLRARSPEQFQNLVDANFAGDSSLRIPAQDFISYFDGKKIDPAAMANEVGVSNLAEAAAAGSDLEIPKENFFGKLDPEHQRGLLPDVVDPATDLTQRQAEAGRQELDEWMNGGGAEKLMGEYAQADEETQATPEWQHVYSDLRQRYVDAGEEEPAAENYATLHANAIANLARNAGLKPDELLAMHNPQLVTGDAHAGPLYQSPAEEPEPVGGATEEGPGLEAIPEETPGSPEQLSNEAAQARGWFRVTPDGRYEIGKTKLGDMSTFIHEPAHAYLELFRELTQREGASEPLKDDFRKVAEWLGTTPEEVYKNGFTREQHEQWASANEQYVREGKAPTAGLQRAFHNFSVWLSSIYRRASALGVELSSDIRGVMDRLYAGEEAVNRAEQEAPRKQLFDNPEEAGWTEDEYRNYANAKGVEVEKAREQVRAEMNEAAAREKTHEWRQERGDVRDAVMEQIDAQPEYRAIRALRKGKLDDGTEISLNRDSLVDQFGEDRVKALQKLHPMMYRSEGGTDAETAGEIFGYGSGEEMMRALEATPRRAVAIERGVRDYLTNRYGDVRYDGTLMDKARFALENQERARNIYREMRALKDRVANLQRRAASQKESMAAISLPPIERYQEAARQMIEQKSMADLQPHRYLDASRKYSREAFEALRKGNAKAAAEAKNKELLNHFLFREASSARDYATKFESYAKRMQSKGIQQRMALAGSDYRDQFNWLMARYKMGPAAPAPERSLRAWSEDVYGQGSEPAIAPGILNEGKYADYRNVPLSEIHDVHDALVNIRHLAQQQFKMFVQGKQVEFAEARAAMMESARENLKSKPERIFQRNATPGERATNLAEQADAMLMRTERLIEWLDGGKQGPWHDNLWNLAADSQGAEYALQHEVTRSVGDAIQNMPESMRKRLWEEKVAVDGIPEPVTRHDLVSMAFNMGNEGNLDRLRKTFIFHGWDPEAVQRIGGMLTHEEWQFVQDGWNMLKPLGERMIELEKRLTGLPPAMVKVQPFKVALNDGTEMDLDGGYYPIKMDPRFSQRAITQDAGESAQNAMQSGYVRATTSRGYTKERTGFGGPLHFDFEQVLTDHTAKAIKDLTHREFMLAANRLLLDTEVRNTLRSTLGPAYEEQFMPWLRTIINDRNGGSVQGLGALSGMMRQLRSNLTLASLSFKVSTSLLQWTHAPRMMLMTRPASYAQAMVDFLAHPADMTREIRELSANEMRYRGEDLDRDIRDKLQDLGGKKSLSLQVARAGNLSIQYTDHVLSFPLWLSVYRDAMTKAIDLPVEDARAQAVHEADSAIRLGLGSAAPKDLPPIMRNNDLAKLLTMFYGFHNGIYNQVRDIGHQFRYDGNFGKLSYGLALSVLAPAILSQLVTGQKPKDGENAGLWAAKRALLFSADTLPFVRDVTGMFDRSSEVHFNPLENVMEKAGKAAVEASSDKENKDWVGIGLNALESGMDVAGVPGTTQAMKIVRYARRAHQGKIAEPTIWGAVAGSGN